MVRREKQFEPALPQAKSDSRAPAASASESVSAPVQKTELLSAKEAARRLGIAVTTFYGWLGLSKHNLLMIRGKQVTIDYLQAGPRGQGHILLEGAEVERLKDVMRVRPQNIPTRRPTVQKRQYPGIVVPLGRPRAQ
jgi:hypothetical protein